MQKKEKKWVRPMLTVLVRDEPRERILQGCKTGVGPGSDVAGPLSEFYLCWERGSVINTHCVRGCLTETLS